NDILLVEWPAKNLAGIILSVVALDVLRISRFASGRGRETHDRTEVPLWDESRAFRDQPFSESAENRPNDRIASLAACAVGPLQRKPREREHRPLAFSSWRSSSSPARSGLSSGCNSRLSPSFALLNSIHGSTSIGLCALQRETFDGRSCLRIHPAIRSSWRFS